MNTNRRSVLLLALASISSAVLASEQGLLLALKIQHAGESRELPNVWCTFGQQVSVQVEPGVSIEFTARDQGSTVELAFAVRQAEAAEPALLQLPRAVVEFGSRSAIRVQVASGEPYELAFRAERSARPSWPGRQS